MVLLLLLVYFNCSCSWSTVTEVSGGQGWAVGGGSGSGVGGAACDGLQWPLAVRVAAACDGGSGGGRSCGRTSTITCRHS